MSAVADVALSALAVVAFFLIAVLVPAVAWLIFIAIVITTAFSLVLDYAVYAEARRSTR